MLSLKYISFQFISFISIPFLFTHSIPFFYEFPTEMLDKATNQLSIPDLIKKIKNKINKPKQLQNTNP